MRFLPYFVQNVHKIGSISALCCIAAGGIPQPMRSFPLFVSDRPILSWVLHFIVAPDPRKHQGAGMHSKPALLWMGPTSGTAAGWA